MSELRAANVMAIRAARETAVEAGQVDDRGYDMLTVPEVGMPGAWSKIANISLIVSLGSPTCHWLLV